MTYRTQAGDLLDDVCRRYYGSRTGAVEAVLEANPGLADRGPLLPAGVAILLPDLPAAASAADIVKLWD